MSSAKCMYVCVYIYIYVNTCNNKKRWWIWEGKGGIHTHSREQKNRSDTDAGFMYEVLNNKIFSVSGNISFVSHFAVFKVKPSRGGPNISESCEGTEYILSAVLHEYVVCFQELNTSNIKITIRPTLWHYKKRGMVLGLPKDLRVLSHPLQFDDGHFLQVEINTWGEWLPRTVTGLRRCHEVRIHRSQHLEKGVVEPTRKPQGESRPHWSKVRAASPDGLCPRKQRDKSVRWKQDLEFRKYIKPFLSL